MGTAYSSSRSTYEILVSHSISNNLVQVSGMSCVRTRVTYQHSEFSKSSRTEYQEAPIPPLRSSHLSQTPYTVPSPEAVRSHSKSTRLLAGSWNQQRHPVQCTSRTWTRQHPYVQCPKAMAKEKSPECWSLTRWPWIGQQSQGIKFKTESFRLDCNSRALQGCNHFDFSHVWDDRRSLSAVAIVCRLSFFSAKKKQGEMPCQVIDMKEFRSGSILVDLRGASTKKRWRLLDPACTVEWT